VALSGAKAADADVAPIRTIGSMQLRRKRFDHPDESRTVEKARIELVELGELAVGRAIFEPGWRWSEHVKPIVGTESCQVHHLGYVVSGHLHVEMTDGASLEVLGGDAFEIPPGHDAWVIGDEPWVSVDWAGRRLFARSLQREVSYIYFPAGMKLPSNPMAGFLIRRRVPRGCRRQRSTRPRRGRGQPGRARR
jgi:quercetin dioxygenase-like cupin family protein